MSWQLFAACAYDTDPTLFDPENERDALVKVASEWCAHCPVLAECAAAAEIHHDWGLRGGTLRKEHTNIYIRDPLIPGAPIPELQTSLVVKERGYHVNWTHCTRGHEVEAPNIQKLPNTNPRNKNKRRCLACSRARAYIRTHPDADMQTEADRYYEEITTGKKRRHLEPV